MSIALVLIIDANWSSNFASIALTTTENMLTLSKYATGVKVREEIQSMEILRANLCIQMM